MSKLSSTKARLILCSVWFIFFVLNLLAVLSLYFLEWIEGDSLKAYLTQLSSSYGVYLGAMMAFYFTNPDKTKKSASVVNHAFILALAGSFVWNLIVTVLTLRLFFSKPIEEATKLVADFGSGFSWLVAAAIGFYFANPNSTDQKS
jgi:hypothetical protein